MYLYVYVRGGLEEENRVKGLGEHRVKGLEEDRVKGFHGYVFV